MCTPSCLEFVRRSVERRSLSGLAVLDVGALDVNGSARRELEGLGIATYVGVDVKPGPAVDEICEAERLVERYGSNRFDVVLATELVEHVRDWRAAISNLKQVLAADGILILTTRSRGFPFHGFPFDYWRYEVDDMKEIFRDLDIEEVSSDPNNPGVFVCARKPTGFVEASTAEINLYSMVRGRRVAESNKRDYLSFTLRTPHHWIRWAMPYRMQKAIARRLPESLRRRLGVVGTFEPE